MSSCTTDAGPVTPGVPLMRAAPIPIHIRRALRGRSVNWRDSAVRCRFHHVRKLCPRHVKMFLASNSKGSVSEARYDSRQIEDIPNLAAKDPDGDRWVG